MPKPRFSPVKRALAEGYRSGLEVSVGDQLAGLGLEAAYESITLSYPVPAKARKYTPDFVLPNGVIVETKGRFVTADRQKHIYLKQAHPDLDVRFVFSNPNAKIGKGSKTSYADWCDKNGFRYAAKVVPITWTTEGIIPARLEAISKAIVKPKGKS